MAQLTSTIEKICSSYSADLREYNTTHKHEIRDKYTTYFKKIVNIIESKFSSDVVVRFILGTGNMTNNPVVYIKSKEYLSQSATEGFYVALLFHSEMDRFYISLNQGTTKYKTQNYRSISIAARSLLNPKSPYDLERIDLGTTSTITQAYPTPHVLGIELSTAQFDEDMFYKHLFEVVGYYKTLIAILLENSIDINSPIDVNNHILNFSRSSSINANVYSSTTPQAQNEISNNLYSSLKTQPKTFAINDRITDTDLLNRENLCLTLTTLISNPKTEVPLTMGLFGKWGSGKSSLKHLIKNGLIASTHEFNKIVAVRKRIFFFWSIDFLKCLLTFDELESVGHLQNRYKKVGSLAKTPIYFIEIDASLFDNRENIWSSIYIKLFELFRKECGVFNTYRYSLFAVTRRFLTANLAPFISLSIVALITYLSFRFSNYFRSNAHDFISILVPNADDALDLLYKSRIPLALVFVSAVIISLLKHFKDFWGYVTKTLPRTQHMERESFKEVAHSDIKDLLYTFIKKKSIPNKYYLKNEDAISMRPRIVLVIDELDRCSDKKIVETLEALQILLEMDNLVSILCMDYDVVCHVIGHMHAYMVDNNTSEFRLQKGREYMEKYVSVPIFVPISDYETYFDNIYGATKEDYVSEPVPSTNSNARIMDAEPYLRETSEEKKSDTPQEITANSDSNYSSVENDTEVTIVMDTTDEDVNLFFEEGKSPTISTFLKLLHMYHLNIPSACMDIKRINPRNAKRLVNILLISRSLVRDRAVFRTFYPCFLLHYFGFNLSDPYKDIKPVPGESDLKEHINYMFREIGPNQITEYLHVHRPHWSVFINEPPIYDNANN